MHAGRAGAHATELSELIALVAWIAFVFLAHLCSHRCVVLFVVLWGHKGGHNPLLPVVYATVIREDRCSIGVEIR